MKIADSLLQKYNVEDAVLVVSSYPKRREKYSNGVCAVAGFTKNTLAALQNVAPDKKIIVLTMILEKEEIYEEDGMLIVRCFKRNHPLSYTRLFHYSRLFSRVPSAIVEFEFASFGDTITTGSLVFYLFSLWLLKKHIILVAHQIVFNLESLTGHIGLPKKSFIMACLNLLLLAYYRLLLLPTTTVVVLEDHLKERLQKITNPKKVMVIPHGVDTSLAVSKISKSKARTKLGFHKDEIVLLSFGYLTWYKGTDFLLHALGNVQSLQGKRIRLVLAGGKSFTQQQKPHYQRFIKKITRLAMGKSHITLTGFVNEEDIPLYFQSADVVLFPYRTFMSSSGPLSLALAFGKPLLISSHLAQLLKSSDAEESLKATGLKMADILFEMNKASLITQLEETLRPHQYKKLSKLSSLISEKRSFATLASSYLALLSRKEALRYHKGILALPTQN